MMNPTLITRRRLLIAMALSPLLWQMRGAQAADVDPQRVVALEWLPAELLLALGVTPYGVADIPNYRLWVNEPALPDSVIDVGLRTEPNLELLTQMKPSFIVWSAGYGPSPEKLARIAPGRGFTFSDGKRPLAMAQRSLLEMADLLGKTQQAKRHLAEFDALMESLRPRFAGRGDRPLLMISLLDPRHVLVFGENCLFQEVLDRFGIKNAWHGEAAFWGSVSVGMVQALAEGGFAAALAEIIASWPWLELDLQVADSHTVSQKVRQADLDVGLILDPQGQAGLSVLAFAELEVGIVMRPDHPLAGAKALSLGELSLERHIVPGAPLIVHERVALLYRHHDFAPENTISCNDIRLIKSLVLRGSGVTLLSLLDVLDEVQRGQLAFVPLRSTLLRPLTLALCTAPSRQLSRPAQMAIQTLSAVIESMATVSPAAR